ncbi:hypothetical protein AKO1_009491 [Acrasis kona]|uniref:Uncharacterized protein n=1 Tax=Acrasis kona TaxID=1008807 RepID=A0AAW2ZLX2_9EUKA
MPLLGYIKKSSDEFNCCLFLYLFRYSRTKSNYVVWFMPLFVYTKHDDRTLFIFIPLIIFYLKDSNRKYLYITFFGSAKTKESNLVIWPLFIVVSVKLPKHQISLICFGLIGEVKEIKPGAVVYKWLLPLSVFASTVEQPWTSFNCWWLLPLINVSNDGDETIFNMIGIYSYIFTKDTEDKKHKLIYFFDYTLCSLQYDSSTSPDPYYGTVTKIKTFTCNVFPIFFYKTYYTTASTTTTRNFPSPKVITFKKYSFTFLYLFQGIGLFNYEFDTDNQLRYYVTFLFYYEKEYDISDSKKHHYMCISIFWVLQPFFSLIKYKNEMTLYRIPIEISSQKTTKKLDICQEQSFYIALLVYMNAVNYKNSINEFDVDTTRTYSFLWVFHPNACLIKHKSTYIIGNMLAYVYSNNKILFKHICIYVFPLFYYSYGDIDYKNNEFKLSLFWLHPVVSLFSWNKSMTLDGTSEPRKVIWGYFYPLFYYTNSDDKKIFNILFIPTFDKYQIAMFSYCIDRLAQKKVIYMMLIFYRDNNHDQSHSNYSLYLFWIFYKRIALCKIWRKCELEDELRTGFYVFLLVYYNQVKSIMMSNAQLKPCFDLSLFWFFYKLFAVFHYSSSSSLVPRTDVELGDLNKEVIGSGSGDVQIVDDLQPIDYVQPVNPQDTKLVERLDEMFVFVLFLFFVSKKRDPYYFKISLFWFLHRILTFVRFSFETHSVKYVIYPLFKYNRVRGQYTKWCIVPFFPIKVSFVANLVAYEKYVQKTGQLDANGKEIKSTRGEDKYVRVLYRVARWQRVDNVTSTEINPIWSYERRDNQADKEDDFRTWDCMGGIIGKKRKRGKDQTRLCCFWYC